MQMKKAAGVDNIPVNLIKELGDSRLIIMTALVKKINMSGE
jgi:hypothetical protein